MGHAPKSGALSWSLSSADQSRPDRQTEIIKRMPMTNARKKPMKPKAGNPNSVGPP